MQEVNHYHALGEGVLNFYIRSCMVFGHCDTNKGAPRLIRVEWNDPAWSSWPEGFPGVRDCVKCLTEQPVMHLEDDPPNNTVRSRPTVGQTVAGRDPEKESVAPTSMLLLEPSSSSGCRMWSVSEKDCMTTMVNWQQ